MRTQAFLDLDHFVLNRLSILGQGISMPILHYLAVFLYHLDQRIHGTTYNEPPRFLYRKQVLVYDPAFVRLALAQLLPRMMQRLNQRSKRQIVALKPSWFETLPTFEIRISLFYEGSHSFRNIFCGEIESLRSSLLI